MTSLGWQIALAVFGVIGLLSVASLFGPWLLGCVMYSPQDLKRKYDAKWALVTGGSSGIGKSLCMKLAAQGLNIVMAAMPDNTLVTAAEELRAKFPGIEIRAVGVNLGSNDPETYMKPLRDATSDIDINIVFNNAGYMMLSFFHGKSVDTWLANHNCNATAAMVIAHHFIGKLLAMPAKAGKKRGCVVFTSSPANILPTPFSAMYGATKSYVTHLATSLAGEYRADGIDVSVLHPSPVATNFYAGSPATPTLSMFKSTAVGPDAVAEVAIRGVGRNIIVDQGYYGPTFRFLLRLLDFTLMSEIVAASAQGTGEYQFLKAAEKKKQESK